MVVVLSKMGPFESDGLFECLVYGGSFQKLDHDYDRLRTSRTLMTPKNLVKEWMIQLLQWVASKHKTVVLNILGS